MKLQLLFAVFTTIQMSLCAQATLPSFYPCEGATPQGYTLDLGTDSLYAAATSCEGSGSLRFNNEGENLIVHTASQPTSIAFLTKGVVGQADFWNGSFYIEESIDAQDWIIIDSIAGQNALPLGTCEQRTFAPQNPESRYIRLIFMNKLSGDDTINGGGNVNIDSIYVDGGEVTGIRLTDSPETEMSIYPNPGKGIMIVKNPEEIAQVSVYAVDGTEKLVVNVTNSTNIELNTEDFARGIYFLRVIGISGREKTQKMIVL